MSEIVFILGAGASKHTGAPLMADFLDRATELYKKGKVQKFKKDFERVFESRSKLQSVHSKAELDLDNIESIFAAFEMGRVINRLPEMEGEQIDLLLNSIRQLISVTLQQTVTYPVRDGYPYPTEGYKSLAELVKDLNEATSPKKCSILTFNYDLALDHALWAYGHPANYCLSENDNPDNTILLKLHGSLNWSRCSNSQCREITPLDLQSFINILWKDPHFEQRLSREKSFHLEQEVASRFSSQIHCNKPVEPDPIIVPPTWNKTEYHQDLSKVWQRAALELSDAENIFVSGFSLTESDSFFRYLFALGSVGKTLINRFWVFDPNEEVVRPRFEKLIGSAVKAKFRFERKTFAEAVDIIHKELLPKK